MKFQHTIQQPVRLKGVGLHSGKIVRLALKPAAPHQGVVFVRTDLAGRPEITAHFQNVVNTRLATVLGFGSVTVSTVEHLLAALQGMGIDNIRVEVEGPEVPIMDGSSMPFVEAIREAGIQVQNAERPTLILKKRIEVRLGEKWAVAEPSSRLEIHGSIDWDHPAIGFQECHFIEGLSNFSEIAPARTFGFMKDVEAMKRMGLALGGTLSNAVVMDDVAVLNPEGLRFSNEFARHKVLDALGDFKLAGVSIQAFIRLHRAGHDLHSQLLTEIFRSKNNYELIQSQESEEMLEMSPRYAASF